MKLSMALVLALSATTLAAPKKDEEPALAKRLYETGVLLFERGEFAEAAAQFEHAYREAQRPELLYNVAAAWDKAGERKKALDSYKKYVASTSDTRDVASARARIAVLEKEMKDLDAERAHRDTEAKPKLPPPLPFVEPVTRYSYQTLITIDGKPYTLIGAGARKVFGFKVYAMGLYLEDEPARKAFPQLAARAGGSDHDSLARGDLAHEFVVLSDFGKAAILHFVRNVSSKETRDAYKSALADDVGDRAPPELRKHAEEFIALFDGAKSGEDLIVRTTAAGQVIVEAHGQKKTGPTDARLTHDIWDIWLGRKPISADLKKSMLDRIDTLGR